MMDFNQLADLGRGFGAIKAHHEKLPHGSILQKKVLGPVFFFWRKAPQPTESLQKKKTVALYLSMSSHTDGDSMLDEGVELFMITTRCASSSDGTTRVHHSMPNGDFDPALRLSSNIIHPMISLVYPVDPNVAIKQRLSANRPRMRFDEWSCVVWGGELFLLRNRNENHYSNENLFSGLEMI